MHLSLYFLSDQFLHALKKKKKKVSRLILQQLFTKHGPLPTNISTPENLLQMQILRSTKSEIRGGGSS